MDIVHLACIIGYYLLPSLLMLVFHRLKSLAVSAIFLIVLSLPCFGMGFAGLSPDLYVA